MVAIAVGSMVAQAGRTSTALLLGLGLALQDRRVEFVQVLTKASAPLPDRVFSPPFNCSSIVLDERGNWEEELISRIDAAHAYGRAAVIDLPAISLSGKESLLAKLSTVLIPLRPGVMEREGAIAFWESVARTLVEAPAKQVELPIKLLPVGWGGSATAISEAISLHRSLSDTWEHSLPPPEIVAWNVPLMLPRALEALSDGGKLLEATALGSIARQLVGVLERPDKDAEDAFLAVLMLLEPHATCQAKEERRRHRSLLCPPLPHEAAPSKKI